MNYLISSSEAKTIGDIKMRVEELKAILELLESHPRVTFISVNGVELQLVEGKIKSDQPVVIMPEGSMPAMTEEDFDYYSSPYYDELLAKKENP